MLEEPFPMLLRSDMEALDIEVAEFSGMGSLKARPLIEHLKRGGNADPPGMLCRCNLLLGITVLVT